MGTATELSWRSDPRRPWLLKPGPAPSLPAIVSQGNSQIICPITGESYGKLSGLPQFLGGPYFLTLQQRACQKPWLWMSFLYSQSI